VEWPDTSVGCGRILTDFWQKGLKLEAEI